jgi:hypothetical protein
LEASLEPQVEDLMRLEAQTHLEAHQSLRLLFHLNDTLPMQ